MTASVAAVLGASLLGGALRVGTPYLYVSLGECLTERSGRVNLGNEGALVLGAMTAYACALASGSPWLGVAAGALAGAMLGAIHGALCALSGVNDIAMGLALMLAGTALAVLLGKPFVQPSAPLLATIPLGFWLDSPVWRGALRISPLLPLGLLAAVALDRFAGHTRPGLRLRLVGDDPEAARALGVSPIRVRLLATTCGSALAGVGGAFLSLVYPGSWNEGLSSGQGLMAVALVILARWDFLACIAAAVLFGAAGALGPALQTIGLRHGLYLAYAAPYLAALLILVAATRPARATRGMPGALSLRR